jgi:ATPase
LHPEWQRMMIPRLLETFPNCQFFISTHSPLVINQLKPENLFMLQNSGNELAVSRPDASYGKSSDRILEDLMTLQTTHPDEVYSDLKNIFRLISDGNTIKAKESIANLRDKGVDDPKLRNAETLIRRRELIGK